MDHSIWKIGYRPRVVFPRGSYVPSNAENVENITPKGTNLEVWTFEHGGKFYAVGFKGKQSKPLFNYRYRDKNHRDRSIKEYIESNKSELESKLKRQKERREFKHGYNVGDILYSSWGYDQTNIDFYQVTKVIGDKMIEMRQVAEKVARSSQGADYVVPVPNKFVDSPVRKRVSPGGSVRLTSYSHAYKWDGKPKYQTGFGYGH